jgi:hypothetical protein
LKQPDAWTSIGNARFNFETIRVAQTALPDFIGQSSVTGYFHK